LPARGAHRVTVSFGCGIGCVLGRVDLGPRTLAGPKIISGSIAFAVGTACLLGISIPTLLHIAKLDLTIAAGPITLALTDIVTLLVYLGLTSVLL
jgi:magnesium transporter